MDTTKAPEALSMTINKEYTFALDVEILYGRTIFFLKVCPLQDWRGEGHQIFRN